VYNGVEKTLKEWTEELRLSYPAMLHRFYIGWRPPELFTTPVGSLFSRGKGGEHHSSKLILDTQTGVFYESLKEAAWAKYTHYKHLPAKLKGKMKNNTSLIYA
jgi:hypothetical protein